MYSTDVLSADAEGRWQPLFAQGAFSKEVHFWGGGKKLYSTAFVRKLKQSGPLQTTKQNRRGEIKRGEGEGGNLSIFTE